MGGNWRSISREGDEEKGREEADDTMAQGGRDILKKNPEGGGQGRGQAGGATGNDDPEGLRGGEGVDVVVAQIVWGRRGLSPTPAFSRIAS